MARNIDSIVEAVHSSNTFCEALRKLGRKPVGGNVTHLRLMCARHSIDTSHMSGQAHCKGKPAYNKKTPTDVFVMGTNTDWRHPVAQLRRALLEIGTPHICNKCGISEWNGKPLVLEIDHIDEQYWNNTRENLQFLCPNCHSLKTLDNA